MKPIKLDRYPCELCGHEEDVPEGRRPNIIKILIVENEHLWCPDCVYLVPIWRKHVNEEHLRGAKQEPQDKSPSPIEVLNPGEKNVVNVVTSGKKTMY